MSTKPNLLNIPSAYKAGTIFSPIPESGAGDLTFTRAGVANRVNSNGIIEEMGANVPRLDYSGGGCPSWLFEPQRTNLLTYSNDFSAYLKVGTVATTPNFGISPSGAKDSTRVVFSADSALYVLSVHSGNNESESIYIKGTAGETIKFGRGNANAGGGNIFTLNGDWQRLESLSTIGNQFTINTYSGTTARDVEIYGAQIEEGGYATSYIKTEASQVTRNTDATTAKDLSSYVTPTNGAMMADIESILGLRDGAFNCVVLGTTNGRLFIYDSTINNYIQANVQNTDGSFSTVELTKRSKVLFNWSATNVDIWVDGVKALSTSKAFSLTNTDLVLDGRGKLSNIYKLGLWNTTLTDLEAAEITRDFNVNG